MLQLSLNLLMLRPIQLCFVLDKDKFVFVREQLSIEAGMEIGGITEFALRY
jgi:hypothetical protein